MTAAQVAERVRKARAQIIKRRSTVEVLATLAPALTAALADQRITGPAYDLLEVVLAAHEHGAEVRS